MGVIAITCKQTGEMFIDSCTDTQFIFNRHRFQLAANLHPNNRLQTLWKQYGENSFEYSIIRRMEYKIGEEKLEEKLEQLVNEYIEKNPQVRRI